jgi:hypothetical protein
LISVAPINQLTYLANFPKALVLHLCQFCAREEKSLLALQKEMTSDKQGSDIQGFPVAFDRVAPKVERFFLPIPKFTVSNPPLKDILRTVADGDTTIWASVVPICKIRLQGPLQVRVEPKAEEFPSFCRVLSIGKTAARM